MTDARIQLETAFVLNDAGRIASTREPRPAAGPLFSLIRTPADCAWAVRADVSDGVADQLNELARREPPAQDMRQPPIYASRYTGLIQGRVESGPAFIFPELLDEAGDVVEIRDEPPLDRHFSGWIPGEIEAGRALVMAVLTDGFPVSVCFCARRSTSAAEAGLETAADFRGRGYAARVTAAWAQAVRTSGRTPLYSTDWSNDASLGVARRLGLHMFATNWNIEG